MNILLGFVIALLVILIIICAAIAYSVNYLMEAISQLDADNTRTKEWHIDDRMFVAIDELKKILLSIKFPQSSRYKIITLDSKYPSTDPSPMIDYEWWAKGRDETKEYLINADYVLDNDEKKEGDK